MNTSNQRVKRKALTQEDFNNIKLLQKAGLTRRQVSQITGRPYQTLAHIFRFDTLDDYRDYHRSRQGGQAKAAPSAETDNSAVLVEVQHLATKLTTIEESLNSLIEAVDTRISTERVNRWRFGGSR